MDRLPPKIVRKDAEMNHWCFSLSLVLLSIIVPRFNFAQAPETLTPEKVNELIELKQVDLIKGQHILKGDFKGALPHARKVAELSTQTFGKDSWFTFDAVELANDLAAEPNWSDAYRSAMVQQLDLRKNLQRDMPLLPPAQLIGRAKQLVHISDESFKNRASITSRLLLVQLLIAEGRLGEAEEVASAWLDLTKEFLPNPHPLRADAYKSLAAVYLARGQRDKRLNAAKKWYGETSGLHPPGKSLAESRFILIQSFCDSEMVNQAIEVNEEFESLDGDFVLSSTYQLALMSKARIALAHLELNDDRTQLKLLSELATAAAQRKDPVASYYIEGMWAHALSEANQDEQAVRVLEARSSSFQQRITPGPEKLYQFKILNHLALIHVKTGEDQRAVAALQEAENLLAHRQLDVQPQMRSSALVKLAESYALTGEYRRATSLAKFVIETFEGKNESPVYFVEMAKLVQAVSESMIGEGDSPQEDAKRVLDKIRAMKGLYPQALVDAERLHGLLED